MAGQGVGNRQSPHQSVVGRNDLHMLDTFLIVVQFGSSLDGLHTLNNTPRSMLRLLGLSIVVMMSSPHVISELTGTSALFFGLRRVRD